MVILGTQYAGEMKKGILTYMMYMMPLRDQLCLHSSANEGPDGSVTVFFGLSGTGMTRRLKTPSAQSEGSAPSACVDRLKARAAPKHPGAPPEAVWEACRGLTSTPQAASAPKTRILPPPGKTTLSADPRRALIGDDEHVWTDEGVFNVEGGCYAKCIALSAEGEPEIFNAIRFGAVVENVIFDAEVRPLALPSSAPPPPPAPPAPPPPLLHHHLLLHPHLLLLHHHRLRHPHLSAASTAEPRDRLRRHLAHREHALRVPAAVHPERQAPRGLLPPEQRGAAHLRRLRRAPARLAPHARAGDAPLPLPFLLSRPPYHAAAPWPSRPAAAPHAPRPSSQPPPRRLHRRLHCLLLHRRLFHRRRLPRRRLPRRLLHRRLLHRRLLPRLQVIYHFISGYTSKMAGTEEGITKPVAAFSSCYGEPFLVWHPVKYAAYHPAHQPPHAATTCSSTPPPPPAPPTAPPTLPPSPPAAALGCRYATMLAEKLTQHNATAWLLNTGWVGGAKGKRCPLKYTRAIVDAIHSGELARVDTRTDPIFGLPFPVSCPGVPSELLDPSSSWADKAEFGKTQAELAALFHKNFDKYASECSAEVIACGPKV